MSSDWLKLKAVPIGLTEYFVDSSENVVYASFPFSTIRDINKEMPLHDVLYTMFNEKLFLGSKSILMINEKI